MATTVLTGKKTWEELVDWYQRFPFGDSDPYPFKVTADTAHFMSWGPDADGLHRTPNPVYFSTKALTTGVFSLAPGDYFKPGNHPNPETYWIRNGTLWLGNPDTGQITQLEADDALLIPAFQFHFGYNFGDKTVEILFMIARNTHTAEMRANPNYDDHYQKFRDPITLHRNVEFQHEQHQSWAQPAYRESEVPPSRMDDLRCWPPKSGKSIHYNHELDNLQIVDHREYLHFATGKNYKHQFLTSFFYSNDQFQSGKIKIPPGRITDPISLHGERVYFVVSETPLIVVLAHSGQALIGHKGDALFVPADVVHQFQNPGHESADAVFFCATREGTTLF